VAITVAVHAIGLAVLLRILRWWDALTTAGLWPITWLLICLTWYLILLHMMEISVWGLFYLWWGCLPDAESALYFSSVTYATIGYGDLVLAKPWRVLAPIEGLTGILMCGLSAGFFFALVNHFIHQASHANTGGDSVAER
jgi:hypothetical protein